MAGTSLGLQLITKLKSGEEESSSSSCESDEEDEPIPLVPMSCEVTPSWSGQRECLHHLCEDPGDMFLQYRVTCSSSTGNMNDLPYYYDNLQSTFLVKSGSFDGSQPPQMHLYGVFTSPSFGPVGSAVCVFNYATMDNVFQTSSFVVRDTSTLVFNSVTGAPVDSHLRFPSLLPSASSHKTSQAQGPSPIFSATGHTFRRIVVDQTTGLDSMTYEVMFIAAVN
ncbi:hypothetical protein EMCRGX_G008425 [Ephydatia muelleri]